MKFPRRFGLLLLALTACRIEQTPASYIDDLEAPRDEIQSSQEELADRLLSLAPALGRGDVRSIQVALAPAAESYMFGPEPPPIQGGELGRALAVATGGRPVTADSVAVRVSPENSIAWFRVGYRSVSDSTAGPIVRFTGVFARQEGEWRLVQGHVSSPVTQPADSVQSNTPAGGG